ncbi:MAG: hypothetical protein QOF96_2114, partial [Actinomycetota bacterium]|nr:hypothetical protein [Actinomycetota bacterium]
MTATRSTEGATCPFLRINRYEDALRFDRHRAILNAAEMFA